MEDEVVVAITRVNAPIRRREGFLLGHHAGKVIVIEFLAERGESGPADRALAGRDRRQHLAPLRRRRQAKLLAQE